MREKLETLPVAVLRDLAKDKQVENYARLKKDELIEAILIAVGEVTPPASATKETAAAEGDAPAPAKKTPARRKSSATARKAEEPAQEQAAPTPEGTEQETKKETTEEKAPERRPARSQDRNADRGRDQRRNNHQNNAAQSQGQPQAQGQVQPQGQAQAQGQTQPQSQPAKPAPQLVIVGDPNDPLHQEFDPTVVDKTSDANGILEVMTEGFGFIRCANYMPGENDVYVAPSTIKKFGLKTGDIITGSKKVKSQGEKFSALIFLRSVNGYSVQETARRVPFEKLTPIFPDERIHLELSSSSTAMRIVDLISPIGKGQRGMIVSQPKAGKTTLLKQIANSITTNNKEMHLIILLIDERPEEVTDIKESIRGDNVEVIYSTFDELPEHHKRVSEMVIERAKRLVEHGQDVCILLDSITRLTRAYNIVVAPSGRTLSGGLDPASLHMPKRFFGAARNMREGGSLTILATALVDTGSKMDDVVYEEFKGTGNMELVLDRKLSERRIFPAIDIIKSGTRREDLLLNAEEQEAVDIMRKALNGLRSEDAAERIIDMFSKTRNNAEFCQMIKKVRII